MWAIRAIVALNFILGILPIQVCANVLPDQNSLEKRASYHQMALENIRFLSNPFNVNSMTFNIFKTISGSQPLDTAGASADFWERATSLGGAVQKYTKDLLHSAVSSYPDITDKIDHFRGTMEDLTASARMLRADMQEALRANRMTLDEASAELSLAFSTILEELKADFPAPDEAPSHEDRAVLVSAVMTKVEERLVRFGVKYGMPEDSLTTHFGTLRPYVEQVLVITGDIVEQHPALLETLLFSGAILLIPEVWFLRPLLSLFGFGPYGPVKGSSAAWAQRRFWGSSVETGSWFSHLQSAGMVADSIKKKIGAGIGIGAGMAGTLFACGRH